MKWHKRPFAALAFETTGETDPNTCRPVSVSLPVMTKHGEKLSETVSVINPGCPIPPEATEFHGITNDIVEMVGLDSKKAMLGLISAFEALHDLGLPVVIYNAPYQLAIFLAELKRFNMLDLYSPVYILDPLLLDRHLHDWRGYRTVENVCDYYGVTVDPAHSARSEALAVIELMRVMVDGYQDVFNRSLHDLYWKQKSWFEAWKKEKEYEITITWPYGQDREANSVGQFSL